MWSMGTIFVELVMRKPFLTAETDMGQLKRMFEVLGTPNPDEWPVSCHNSSRPWCFWDGS
jgi:cyclin-dependent kinase 7